MAEQASSSLAFQDLDRRTQRRLLMHAVARIAFGVAAVLALYVIVPDAHRSGSRAVLELTLGLLAFAALIAWQIQRIVSAPYPGLRAIEALALAGPVLVVVFAFTYLSLSHTRPGNFSQPLDHIGAMYFTVTVISRSAPRLRRHRPAHRRRPPGCDRADGA